LIPPRPRLYGLVGADVIEQVWKERQSRKARAAAENGGNGADRTGAEKSVAH